MPNSTDNLNSAIPTDENPQVPPGTAFAFPWVEIYTNDKEFYKQAENAIMTKLSNVFSKHGNISRHVSRGTEQRVEFDYALGQTLGVAKGEDVDTVDKVVAFTLEMLKKMGAS